MPEARDPRDIVTPYAFRVAPEILGVPLAGPFRRATAMLVDLLLLAVLLLVKEISATLLGLVFAWILFKISSPRAREGVTGPIARPVVRAAAYGVLLISGLALGSCFLGFIGSDGPTPPRGRVAGGPQEGSRGGELGVRETMGMVAAVAQITSARDSAAAQGPADRFAIALARSGVSREEREEAVRDLLRVEEAPWRLRVAAVALARADSAAAAAQAAAPSRDRTAASETAGDTADTVGLSEGDTPSDARASGRDTLVGSLPPDAAEALAGALEAAAEARSQEPGRARPPGESGRDEPSGLMRLLGVVADDLGIGLGWACAYFTVFLVLMGGQTPGKRLLGCRVVHLNGTPIGWWSSFERFGGYAAGLATGLLGFLEIFWDANRQGVHDRISGTVVVRTRGGPVTLDRAAAGRPTAAPAGRPSHARPQAPRTG